MAMHYRALLGFAVALLPLFAFAGVSNADLQKQYGDKVLTLRQFYPGEHLHFDSDGKPLNAGVPGAWTLDGQLRVQQISLSHGALRIKGQRLFLFYDPETKKLRDLATINKHEPVRKQFRNNPVDWAAHKGKLEIEVDGVNSTEMADVAKIMDAVFLAQPAELADVVPEFWKPWLEPPSAAPKDQKEEKPYKVGGSVSPPKPMSTPDPNYSKAAKQAGYQAVAVLWVVLDTDGTVKNVRIARPAGMGLDEEAVAAVQNWKFNPAMKDGQPVAVHINVEVNFRLY